MKPFGPLMIEHRLIEQFIDILRLRRESILQNRQIDRREFDVFIDTAVDFFRTYADRTHHGKEEDILFKRLQEKDLSAKDAKTVHELIEQHAFAREHVDKMMKAKEMYVTGVGGALEDVLNEIEILVRLYPPHIELEDNHFFKPIMKYFSKEEQEQMLKDFEEFDRKMVHEKHQDVVEKLRGPRDED